MFLTSGLTISGGLTIGSPSDSTTIYNSLLLTGQYGSNAATNNTFVDSSAYNNTITRNGTPTVGSFSPYDLNNSVFFNGSSDYLTMPASTNYVLGTNNFTIEVYVYVNTVTGSQTIIDMRNGTAGATGVWLYLNTNTIRLYTAGADRITSSTVAIGTWYHVALVRNSGVTTMYLNGTATGSTYADTNTYILNGPFIGRDSTAASNYMNGYISNLRIVRGTALYTATFTPPTATLTAVSGTTLLVCQSNRFIDTSTNAATVTVVSGPQIAGFSPFVLPLSYNPDAVNRFYTGSGWFNGSTDYLSMSNSALAIGNGDFTLECWVNAPTGLTDKSIFEGRTNGSGTTGFTITAITGTSIRIYSGTSALITSGSINYVNTWCHVAVSRVSGTTTLYINGVSQGTSTSLGNLTDFSFLIGAGRYASPPTVDAFFSGYISNFRIVKGTALYTSNFTPPALPLTSINNTTLLMNFTNAGIPDYTMNTDVVTIGDAQLRTAVTNYNPTSIFFDGTGDRLAVTSSEALNLSTVDFTVEAWVYTNTIAAGEASVCYRGAFGNIATGAEIQWSIGRNGSSLTVRPYQGTTDYTINIGTIAANTWYHVALTRSGNTFRGFLNGVQAATTFTISGALNNNTAWFGAIVGLITVSGVNLAWNGYIDEIRITRGLARYTANFTPPTGPLPLS